MIIMRLSCTYVLAYCTCTGPVSTISLPKILSAPYLPQLLGGSYLSPWSSWAVVNLPPPQDDLAVAVNPVYWVLRPACCVADCILLSPRTSYLSDGRKAPGDIALFAFIRVLLMGRRDIGVRWDLVV